jgi:hypothetical protein
MALTKIGKEGITGISNASDATFLTATSGEGVTLAGTLAVTGVHTVGNNAIYTSDGGGVTQNTVQGLLKSWVNFNGAAGTLSARDSFNVSTITDNSTGNYSLTFSNNMNNSGYSASSTGNADYSASGYGIYAGVTEISNTTTCNVTTRRTNGNADSDPVCVQIAGDLA